MAIRTTRFPEYGLNLYVVSGAHTAEEAIGFFRSLGAPDATRWLTVFDPVVDMSGLDVASLPGLKRTIAEKHHELFGAAAPELRIIVCSSRPQEEFFSRFWSGYVLKGEQHPPAKPVIVTGLEAAFDVLELPPAARDAVTKAIRGSEAAAVAPPAPIRIGEHR